MPLRITDRHSGEGQNDSRANSSYRSRQPGFVFQISAFFPRPFPIFDRLFPRYNSLRRIVGFVPYQRVYSVESGKSFHQVVLMLPDTVSEI